MQSEREFSRFFDEAYPALFRFIHSLTGSRQTALDVAQEAFLRLLRRGPSAGFDQQRFWLFRVARNLALNDLARNRTRDRLNDEAARFIERTAADPEDELLRSERHRTLLDLLDSLTPDQRAALLLREQEGMSYAEIAGTLGVSVAKVRVDVCRARQRLRSQWQRIEARRDSQEVNDELS